MAIEDLLHPLLKHYLEAPRWLKASAAGHAYAWLPQSLRLGSAYNTFRGELAASQGAVAVGDLATRKLEATLSWAIETVPAYRQYRSLLARSGDPRELLARLPVTDKLDIKRDPACYLSRAMPASRRLKMFTGALPATRCSSISKSTARDRRSMHSFRTSAIESTPARTI